MVDVNWGGIARAARALGGEGTNILTVRTTTPCGVDVLDGALPPDEGDGPAKGGWFAGPKGWLLLIEGLEEQVNPWIEDLAGRLSAAGVEGTLTGAGSVGQPLWAQRMETHVGLNGVLGFRPRSGVDYHRGGWVGEGASLDAAIALGMGWVTAHGGDVMAHPGLLAGFWADPDAAAHLMARDATSLGRALTTSYHRQRVEVRHASVSGPSTLALSTISEGYPWEQMVEELRSALLAAPLDLISVAMVSNRSSLAEHELDSAGNYHSRAYEWHPERWAELIVDPCGIQVLTNRHLEASHDLSAWRTTRLDDEHVLVEARDLGPWYATPRRPTDPLDPPLMDQARRDFGDMLLTPALAEDLGLTIAPKRI